MQLDFGDAAFANCKRSFRCTGGIIIVLFGKYGTFFPIYWASRLLPGYYTSTPSSESRIMFDAGKIGIEMHSLLCMLLGPWLKRLSVSDSAAAIQACAAGFSSKMRADHVTVGTRFGYMKMYLSRGLRYGPTHNMLADIFTKIFGTEEIARPRYLIGVWPKSGLRPGRCQGMHRQYLFRPRTGDPKWFSELIACRNHAEVPGTLCKGCKEGKCDCLGVKVSFPDDAIYVSEVLGGKAFDPLSYALLRFGEVDA